MLEDDRKLCIVDPRQTLQFFALRRSSLCQIEDMVSKTTFLNDKILAAVVQKRRAKLRLLDQVIKTLGRSFGLCIGFFLE